MLNEWKNSKESVERVEVQVPGVVQRYAGHQVES